MRNASAELKRDQNIVLEAVMEDGDALRCASPELQGDEDISAAIYKP